MKSGDVSSRGRAGEDDESVGVERGSRERADAVVLGEVTVVRGKSDQFPGLLTAHLYVDLKCLSPAERAVCGSGALDATGAAYSDSEALANTVDRSVRAMGGFVDSIRP